MCTFDMLRIKYDFTYILTYLLYVGTAVHLLDSICCPVHMTDSQLTSYYDRTIYACPSVHEIWADGDRQADTQIQTERRCRDIVELSWVIDWQPLHTWQWADETKELMYRAHYFHQSSAPRVFRVVHRDDHSQPREAVMAVIVVCSQLVARTSIVVPVRVWA